MKQSIMQALVITAASVLAITQTQAQGDLNPPGPPGPTMKTLTQVEPRTPIGGLPVTLAAPGSYYLTGDLAGAGGEDGITVEADDVTIDLGGFALTGVPGSLNGIVVNGTHTNLMVKGGTIRGWGGSGVAAASDSESASGCSFFNVRAVDNGGVGLKTGQRSTVKDCVATGNQQHGILADYHSVISGCVASGNQQAGIESSGGGTIHDCLAMNNGIGITCGDVSVIEGCTSRDNGGNGFFAGAGSVVGRCAATANSGNGVQTGLASTVKECSAKNNVGAGVSVDAGSTVRDCVSRQNGAEGIYLTDRCLILDNNCSENTGDGGIRVSGSKNRIEGNHMTDNAVGLKVEADSNFIVRNTALGSEPGFVITGVQTIGPIELVGPISTASPWANFTDAVN